MAESSVAAHEPTPAEIEAVARALRAHHCESDTATCCAAVALEALRDFRRGRALAAIAPVEGYTQDDF